MSRHVLNYLFFSFLWSMTQGHSKELTIQEIFINLPFTIIEINIAEKIVNELHGSFGLK